MTRRMRVAGSQVTGGGFRLSNDRVQSRQERQFAGGCLHPTHRNGAMDEATDRFRQLEVFVVAYGHAGWSFDGFDRNEF